MLIASFACPVLQAAVAVVGRARRKVALDVVSGHDHMW
jgi:hypothetical protein